MKRIDTRINRVFLAEFGEDVQVIPNASPMALEAEGNAVLESGKYPSTLHQMNPLLTTPVDFSGMPVPVREENLTADECDDVAPFVLLGFCDEPGYEYTSGVYESMEGNKKLKIVVNNGEMLRAYYSDGTHFNWDHTIPSLMMTEDGFEIAPTAANEWRPEFDWPWRPDNCKTGEHAAYIQIYSQPFILEEEDYDFLDRAWDMLRTRNNKEEPHDR